MIICANIECKYRNNKGKCTCKKVLLSSWHVRTVNMGYKDFLECKSFEYDEEYLEMAKKLKDLGIIPEVPSNENEKE